MFIDFQILNAIESKTKHSDLKMIKGQIDRIARIRLGWKMPFKAIKNNI